jgi:hypothetical protein
MKRIAARGGAGTVDVSLITGASYQAGRGTLDNIY